MALGETVGLWPGTRGTAGPGAGTIAVSPVPAVHEIRPRSALPAHRAAVVDLGLWAVGVGPDTATPGTVDLARSRPDSGSGSAAPGSGSPRPGAAHPGAPLDAARESLRRGRFGEAARAARRALCTGRETERAEALLVLAVALWQGPEPVSAALFRIRTLWAEHADGRPAARLVLAGPLAVLYGMGERGPEARAALAAARAAAAEVDPAGGAVLLPLLTAEVESLAGRHEGSRRLLAEAAETASVLGLDRLREAADGALVRRLGDVDRTGAGRLSEADRAVGAATATDSPVAEALARLDRAEALRLAGRPEDARREVCLAGLCFARKGHVPGVCWASARHAALASPDHTRA